MSSPPKTQSKAHQQYKINGTHCYKNVIKKQKIGNTIITLLSLLKVKQGFISSMDHCGIYIKCLIQITNAVI